MEEKRILSVNPELFNFSSKSTRKKQPKEKQNGGIRIKSVAPKKKENTLKNRTILNMIRQRQSDHFNKLFENKSASGGSVENKEVNTFNKDFDNATSFLQNLAEKKKDATQLGGTLKKYPHNSLLFHPNESYVPKNENTLTTQPHYGCLKGGELPTYRSYMNKTSKNQQPIIIGGKPLSTVGSGNLHNPIQNKIDLNMVSMGMPAAQPVMNGGISQIKPNNVINTNSSTDVLSGHVAPTKWLAGGEQPAFRLSPPLALRRDTEQKINDSMQRMNDMKHATVKLNELKKKMHPKNMKQKRTIRRTYKTGKSKVFPRVSVLVSNKTIRNNISTKTQLLKQVPIQDVRKYLMKHGFIRVGSIAPNDVLRKMYESAILICGEVQNHNPDNLLYNFLNGE